eukprot:Lankesteria_metandrocarpae@DN8636_c0_g1_i1.p1
MEETQQPQPGKNCRVYVGNLAWSVRGTEFKDHMKDCGQVVRAEIFMDRQGRSAGCGIVEYASQSEAQSAISSLHNTMLHDRQIFVREDREDTSEGNSSRRGTLPRMSAGGGGGSGGGGSGGGGGGSRGGR